MYTFPPTIFVIDLFLYSPDTRKSSAGASAVENALHVRVQAGIPFRATMFQKSGLKHIAAADTQRDCLEKSTREESGGSEEAMTNEKNESQDCNALSTTTREDPNVFDYSTYKIRTKSKEQRAKSTTGS